MHYYPIATFSSYANVKASKGNPSFSKIAKVVEALYLFLNGKSLNNIGELGEDGDDGFMTVPNNDQIKGIVKKFLEEVIFKNDNIKNAVKRLDDGTLQFNYFKMKKITIGTNFSYTKHFHLDETDKININTIYEIPFSNETNDTNPIVWNLIKTNESVTVQKINPPKQNTIEDLKQHMIDERSDSIFLNNLIKKFNLFTENTEDTKMYTKNTTRYRLLYF